MTEFDTGFPSIRQIQGWITEQQAVEFKLLTGEVMSGRVFWQDPHCICLQDESEQPILVWRQAIAHAKLQA
ncbi:RNA-binding protein hfq [Lusitaniella coriacea LEGE 07157]|uniref:RNA-binding protein hfq n=1 Tax=Lusitaniella coriacea LEGE 07157 TaxID=945747 RepID=A0A8J7E2Q8_9CYAN|nr:RNA-binding protein hfq [Lusitaniella coriacea]MBE9118661.1 RNA-binding protein hfq [Lusitaniella coriacea LEGE 07157]